MTSVLRRGREETRGVIIKKNKRKYKKINILYINKDKIIKNV
jgi:hypothetical protein